MAQDEFGENTEWDKEKVEAVLERVKKGAVQAAVQSSNVAAAAILRMYADNLSDWIRVTGTGAQVNAGRDALEAAKKAARMLADHLSRDGFSDITAEVMKQLSSTEGE